METTTQLEALNNSLSYFGLKKVITIGDYQGRIYKEYIEVGCQTVSKKQIEEILEIMNK